MRNPVRKFVGVAVLGVLAALFALPMAAGAQTNGSSGSNGVPPDPPGACSFTVTPLTAGVGTVLTISGTAPSTDNTTVFLFINGNQVANQAITTGAFSFQYTLLAGDFQPDGSVGISVNFTFGNQNAYTSVCTGTQVGGETVVRVKSETVTRPAAASAALAFTGSSDTPSYVLIGIAAVLVGAVLVVAARRRSNLS